MCCAAQPRGVRKVHHVLVHERVVPMHAAEWAAAELELLGAVRNTVSMVLVHGAMINILYIRF